MNRLLRALGCAWASPLTLLGLAYACTFDVILGHYRYIGRHGDALAWEPNRTKLPKWLARFWRARPGQAFGNVIIVSADPNTRVGHSVLSHEQDKVRQMMVLGPLWPILYALVWLVIRVACPRSSPHFSHPFDVEARRAAGQVIDVEGALVRLHKLP